jgi:hypothetical protein
MVVAVTMGVLVLVAAVGVLLDDRYLAGALPLLAALPARPPACSPRPSDWPAPNQCWYVAP